VTLPGSPPLQLLRPPYRRLRPLSGSRHELRELGRDPGSALVWSPPTRHIAPEHLDYVRGRPGGLSLILVLPPATELPETASLLRMVEESRPASILPHLPDPEAEELAELLRRPPDDLPAQVTEYLRWRGFRVDRETVRLIRRVVELSAELRSVSALARGLYLSRRALGRRFMTRGLPVPSHWLHFSRLLRVLIHLQTTDDAVARAGYRLGYGDGFALSNQMVRLTGIRPSEARRHLGWEWFMEAWLRCEAEAGHLRPELLGTGVGGEEGSGRSSTGPAAAPEEEGAEAIS